MGPKMEDNSHRWGMSLLLYYIQAVPQISLQLLLICACITEGRIRSPFLPCCQLAVVVRPCRGRDVCCDPASSGSLFPKEECSVGNMHRVFFCGYICISQLKKGKAWFQALAYDHPYWLSVHFLPWFCSLARLWFSQQCPGTAQSMASVRTRFHKAVCVGLSFSGQTWRELQHGDMGCVMLLD